MKRWIVGLLVATLALAACGSAGQAEPAEGSSVQLAPRNALSSEVSQAPVAVREAYQFAIANPELLQQIPCYCGCGSVGHQSNLQCYVDEFLPDGSIELDRHALG